MDDADAKKELKENGFDKAVRTIKKTNNEVTSFVRLSTSNKKIFEEHVFKRAPVMLFYQRFYALKEVKPHQCWNCQGLGHLAFDCPNVNPTCLQCGEDHRVNACPHAHPETKTSDKTFCFNCKCNDHNSASRLCYKLKQHVKELIKQKAEQTTVNIQKPSSNTNNPNKTLTKPKTQQLGLHMQIKWKITKIQQRSPT